MCLDGTLVRTDRVAARTHALPALYRAASLGPPTLADKGYTEADIGIKVPDKNPSPDPTPDDAMSRSPAYERRPREQTPRSST